MDKRETILKTYQKIVKKYKKIPTYTDFVEYDVSKSAIRHNFGNLTKLHDLVENEYSEYINDHIAHESLVFSKQKMADLDTGVNKFNRFFITTAINGKKIDLKFYNTIKKYCEANNCLLLILPCADIASTKAKVSWTFAKELSEELFIHQETKLNEKLFLSNIKLSAKQINPTTGLSRIGQRNGSYIFASPKQSLEYVATSAQEDKIPMALMTPGAVTISDYHNEKYMSERTSYIANNDHVMGGVIVEIASDKKFHFRQVQANKRGEFVDLGIRYYPSGKTKKETVTLVMGDYHCGWTDLDVKDATNDMFNTINIKDVVVHDFLDGYSVNHHIKNSPGQQAINHQNNRTNLQEEINLCVSEMNWLHERISGNIIHTRGNHDDRLENWLLNAEYANDRENHYTGLKLATVLLEGKDPLKHAITTNKELKHKNRILWLSRDDEFKIGNVELGQHGDKGSNGTKGSLLSIEKAYGNCVVAHTHSGAILRGVFRVGTSTKLKLDYNKGPSSWTHTHCLVSNDGSRQLINIIEGEWKI